MPNIHLRYGGAVRGQQRFNICPTLIVGLGGSGKEVLLRLRRLFFTKHRKVGLPILEYLWIDTDVNPKNIRGQDYDAIFKKLLFSENEKLDASVPPASVASYFFQ